MKKQPNEVYFTFLTDVVDSKGIADRKNFAANLKRHLKEMSIRHRGNFYAPPVQSKGIDELSAIVKNPGAIPDIIFDLAIDLHPRSLRFAIATGEISPLSRIATKADGVAFHRAAKSLQSAESTRRLFKMDSLDFPGKDLSQMLIHQMLTIIASWPAATAVAAREKWYSPNLKNDELAQKLGVTPQAISKKLRRSRLDELRETREILTSWFSTLPSSPLN